MKNLLAKYLGLKASRDKSHGENQGSWRLGIQHNVVTGEEAGSLRQIQPMFAVFEYRGFHRAFKDVVLKLEITNVEYEQRACLLLVRGLEV